MSRSVHERARELITLAGAEDLADGQQTWLQTHLRDCVACLDYAEATGQTVRALRSQPFVTDSVLVRATQRRVRLRAIELRQRQERVWLVSLVCLFVGLSTALTTPLFWRAFEWIGMWAGFSSWVWEAGFTIFWITPALVVSAFLLIRGAQLAADGEKR